MPKLECDVVMKGGITSGIVYPKALARLSEHFHFRSVGGTSAGAIAAAALAAAELGRLRGRGSAFAGLAALPGRLGEPLSTDTTRLASLFQPAQKARGLFDLLLALATPQRRKRLFMKPLLSAFPLAWLGILPGLALFWLDRSALMLAIALLAMLSGYAILYVLLAFARLHHVLRTQFFGLCSGMSDSDTPALTQWLDSLLIDLAGNESDQPLTFGELYAGKGEQAIGDKAIRLEMMSTCLSLGRPYRLPLQDGEEPLYFNVAEFEKLFPASTLAQLTRHSPSTLKSDPRNWERAGYLRLPDAAHWPVLLAVRMSLSFPILLAAVPLYLIDRRSDLAHPDGKPRRVWFSDGGITSNFPVHFFDAGLPLRPTFAFNLLDRHSARERQMRDDQHVYLHTVNQPRENLVTDIERGHFALSFLQRIFVTAQTWSDSTLIGMPGQRDRIVEIYLDPNEGGLNLNMTQEVISNVSGYGEQAADLLIAAYVDPTTGGVGAAWNNHAWIRQRTALGLACGFLKQWHFAWHRAPLGGQSHAALIVAPPSYQWDAPADQRSACALDLAMGLDDLGAKADAWRDASAQPIRLEAGPFGIPKDLPKPVSEWRARPRI